MEKQVRDKFTVALIQMSCGSEPADNLAKAVHRVAEAAREGADVVCLPELFQTQYFCQREEAALFDLAEPIPGATTETLAAAARKNKVVLIASGGISHRFWDLAVIRQRASADPRDINGAERRAWDERIMAWWRDGDHAAVLAHADEFRQTCSPEGRFAHYLVLAGAFGRGAALGKGEQFGRYEAAIGTGQAIFWFDPVPAAATLR